jgi:hypothetical protein
MSTALLTLLVTPFVWSAVVAGLRHALRPRAETPEDGVEKALLIVMLMPVVLGFVLLAISRFAPVSLPFVPFPVLLQQAGTAAGLVNTSEPKGLAASGIDLMAWCIGIGWALYAAGVLIKVVPLVLAFIRLGRLVSASRLSEVAGEVVYATEAAVPPLAWGRETVLLPASLIEQFSEHDLLMIIRHEREHLRRGDTYWFAALSWIDALLWFNPFIRQQTAQCRIAAEIACDAAVAQAAPAAREAYARVLVQTLKHTAGDVRQYAPAVFSPMKSGDYRMRILQIMHADATARKPRRRWLYAGLIAAALPVVFAQLAWSQGRQRLPSADEVVYAPGKGTIVQVHQVTSDDPDMVVYGNARIIAVKIDHGAGVVSDFTVENTDLKVGDKVYRGQVISKSGPPVVTVIKLAEATGTVTKSNCPASATGPAGDPWCVLGNHITSFKDSRQFIAWGDKTELRVNGRKIRADMIYSDPKAEIAFAQGHVVLDDAQ